MAGPRPVGTVTGMSPTTTEPVLVQHDPEFEFRDPLGRVTVRPLRVWRVKGTGLVAVVTEPANSPGMSITNAAEQVVAAVRALYPRQQHLTIVEHYPASGGLPESFDQVVHTPGQPGVDWRPIPASLLLHSLNLDQYPDHQP